MTGQNLVVRAEHVVKLVHGIDDRLDLAFTKRSRIRRRFMHKLMWLTVSDHLRYLSQRLRSFLYAKYPVGQEVHARGEA